MANTKTKIPAGLQVFTDSIITEQLKQVEEAITKQNAAIENLSQRMEEVASCINMRKPQPPEGLSKTELEAALDEHISDLTGKLAEKMKNQMAGFRGEVTTLRKERQAEHQELLDQRAHQHRVFIRIVIAIPIAALLILFSSGYLHYHNSAVYWGNRAYNAAKAAGAHNPGMYYQFVQANFADSIRATTKAEIKRIERGEYKPQAGK